ncbi:hypothetical protein [Brevundimonas sp.]|uniref:hypothetical protein n=1 Tax=Brevundimonas sp. TaxID=1871086 RepID=UPI0026216D57|nr:hypothetical protein [Brevundimonas sp.]
MNASYETNTGDQAGSFTPDKSRQLDVRPVEAGCLGGQSEPLEASTSQISSVWKVIHTDEIRPISMRAIWPKGVTPSRSVQNLTFTASRYPTAAERRLAFEGKAAELSTQGYNIYVVMNPVREDFAGGAVSDGDIAFRDLLLIDIDRAGSTKDPASDEEVEAAIKLADEVAADSALQGLDLRARVMSGNGAHLYYALDRMPNDGTSTALVKELLRLLARKFDTEEMKIDQSVVNASRITKVPGTLARKGEASSERPYRIAEILLP